MNAQGPKVLMISSDRLIGVPGSSVRERMREYGQLVGELHIILLSDLKHSLKDFELSQNVWVYPTGSISKFLRPFDAVKIGRRLSPDLITAQDPFECGWAGLELKRLHRVPLEVQLHTNPFSPRFDGPLNTIRRLVAKRVLPQADSIRVVLENLRDELAQRAGLIREKISVLPIYVDRKRFASEPQFDLHERYGFARAALCVSRLTQEKNLGLAIEAVSKLDGVGLVIVGAGPEEGRLRKLAERTGARVSFAGWQDDLNSFYKTADVFIQTSLYEGYGLSLIEAGLCALPAVTTNVGVASEFENGREIVIAEPNVEDFARALGDLLESDVRRKDLGINFCRAVEAHIDTKEAYLAKLSEGWLKLIKKSS